MTQKYSILQYIIYAKLQSTTDTHTTHIVFAVRRQRVHCTLVEIRFKVKTLQYQTKRKHLFIRIRQTNMCN